MSILDYMDDYRHLRIDAKGIFEDMGISRGMFNKRMKEKGLLTNFGLYKLLDIGIDELNTSLKSRYSSIVVRCNNYESYQYKDGVYKDMEYLPLDGWIQFCLDNKDKLQEMWSRFIESERNMQLAISVDRIDESRGYLLDNIQFVTMGYNSLKRNLRPIKVTHKGEDFYFMTTREGGRYFGVREKSFGDMLAGVYREISKEYTVVDVDKETVLRERNIGSLQEYHDRYFVREES